MKLKGEDNTVKEVTCFLHSVLKNASHLNLFFIQMWQQYSTDNTCLGIFLFVCFVFLPLPQGQQAL